MATTAGMEDESTAPGRFPGEPTALREGELSDLSEVSDFEPAEEEIAAYSDQKSHELLVARVRFGAVAIVVSTTIMSLMALWFGTPSGKISPFGYAGLGAVAAAGFLLGTRLAPSPWLEWIVLLLAALAGGFGGWSSIVAGQIAEACVLEFGFAMACGLLLPWAPAKQAAICLVALSAIVACIYNVEGTLFHSTWAASLPAIVILMAVSIFATNQAQHARRRSARDELMLAAAKEHLQEINALLETRVRQRTAELSDLLDQMQSFSYTVSHDLRSPLRSINGYATLLEDQLGGRLAPGARQSLERMRAAAIRMDAMISSILKLTRVSHAELRRERVDLSCVAREIAERLSETGGERVVEWRIPPGIAAQGDPALLRDVLENLLGNAWKFTSQQESARIELGMEPRGAVYFVADNGAGFDPRHVHHLFQPHTRLHHQDEFEGEGIGLATVRSIVTRHGGRVWAEGRPGAGATFYFTLPGR